MSESFEFGEGYEVNHETFATMMMVESEIFRRIRQYPHSNYIVCEPNIFCKKCQKIIIDPKITREMVNEAIEQYKKEGVWDKHGLHGRFFIWKCQHCGTEHYLGLVIVRYGVPTPEKTIERTMSCTLMFQSLEDMKHCMNNIFPKWGEEFKTVFEGGGKLG